MLYTIENEYLKITVNSHGAEVVSVIDKTTQAECMWEGDPKVWGRHAPILFPYTGKLTGGSFTAKGRTYTGGQHGFARDMEHSLVEQEGTRLVLLLSADTDTYEKFPYDFALYSEFALEGKTLHHALRVENPGDEILRFGIGYHPAFACPFDADHDTEDYEFRFNEEESPLVIDARPNGLLSGKNYYLGSNLKTVQLTDHLFDNDSYCMVNLRSTTLGIYEKDSDRSVVCRIEGFPYTLIWSKPGEEKVRFVCIEPWHALTGPETGSTAWEDRPATRSLTPGQSFTCCLSTTFNR